MLIEKMIATMIALTAIVAMLAMLPMLINNKNKIENNILFAEKNMNLSHSLTKTCLQYNTFSYEHNSALKCLYTDTCSNGMSGKLHLVDEKGLVLSDAENPLSILYNKNLMPCDDCGDSSEAYLLDVEYKVTCEGANCSSPLLEFQASYNPTSESNKLLPLNSSYSFTPEKVFSSCEEAYSRGHVASGVYNIDFDGFAGECPMKIYCKMSSDTQRMLLINAPKAGYESIPVVEPPVTPSVLGKLSDETIQFILENLNSSTKEISVDVKESAQGDLTVGLSTTSAEKSKVSAEVEYCTYNNDLLTAAQGSPSSKWEFVSKNGEATVGYSERSVAGELQALNSFHCLNGLAHACNLGANSCNQVQLGGAVWVKN